MRTNLSEIPTDIEFLSFLLRDRKSSTVAKADAKALLEHFGSLPAILMAPRHTLASRPELGIDLADRLMKVYSVFLGASFRRALRQPYLSDPNEIIHYALWRLSEQAQEQVMLIYLNKAGFLLFDEIIAKGTAAEVMVSPRCILAAVLAADARAFVMVHNHPSGNTRPSPLDLQMTCKIRDLSQELGLTLVDHLIVGNGNWHSFRFSNELSQHY